MKRVATAFFLCATALAGGAQTPRDAVSSTSPSATISGRVVAEEGGDPLPNAWITVIAGATSTAFSDGDGRFSLSVPPGRYSVAATKSGYARREVAQIMAGEPIEIRLRRGAAISGRVADQFGDPVLGARVTAETMSGSSPTPTVAAATATDDRGEYRLAPLPAGTFVVAVMTRGEMVPITNNDVTTIPPAPRKTFYPDTTAAKEAAAFPLQAGEDRSGIDFVLSAAQGGGEPGRIVSPLALVRGPTPGAVPQMKGMIRGRVVATDGHAVPRAEVLVSQAGARLLRAATADEEGRFEFAELAAGTFRLLASKTGYSSVDADGNVVAGMAPAVGRSIDLADGETRERADVTLARWGSMSGRVLDEYGDPIQGVSVQAFQVRYAAGRKRLVAAGAAARITDDLGHYRLFSVPPGQYIVSASAGALASSDLPGYARSYFPATTNPADAQFVPVRISQDVTAIELSLSRTRTARVAGTLVDAAGEPTMGGTVALRSSQRSNSVTSESIGARISRDGVFEFASVPPGLYVIQADRGRSNPWTEGEFGSLPVSVNGTDLTGQAVHMAAGSAITGRFTFDSADRSKAVSASAIGLSPIPVDYDLSPTSVATARIHDDWTFEIAGVNGPRRLQVTRTPSEWMLKEILVHGIDVTDRPLSFGRKDQSLNDVEIVLTDRITELSGTIADDRARPVSGAFVVVFSTDRDRWYQASRFLRRTAAGANGVFSVTGLSFGAYYVAAVAQLPPYGEDGWQDPDFLERLAAGATTVTLSEGQKQLVNLRLPSR